MTIAGVKDPAGNPVATVTNSFTTGATYDIASPSATNSDPPSGTTIGTNVTPKMVFNKPLNPITVNNSTFRMFLNDTGQFIPLSVTCPPSGLEVTWCRRSRCCPTPITTSRPAAATRMRTATTATVSTFTSIPTAARTRPAPPSPSLHRMSITGIPLNAQVTATLNVPMDPTSWSQSSIQLLNGTTPVAGTVSFTNSQTLTFVPAANLAAGITYTVHVGNFTDANGNAVVPVTTGFTTGYGCGNGRTHRNQHQHPGNGSTNDSNTQPIILTFSQILDPSTVNSATLKVMNTWNSNQGIAGTYMVSGNTVTFTPNQSVSGRRNDLCGRVRRSHRRARRRLPER